MKKKSLSSDDLTWKENEIHPLYTYYKSKNHPYSKYYDIENPDFYIGSLKRKTSKSTDKKIENAKKKTTKKVKLTAKSTKDVCQVPLKQMKKVHKTTLQEFCSKTTLHGWSFLGQTNIFWTIPGMFWSTIILFSVISTIFLMGTTIQEFMEASVTYKLESSTVPLNEVFFPSVVICNMNTLRKSFIADIIKDPGLTALNVTFKELKRIVKQVYILGEDYELSEREMEIVEAMFSSETYNGLFEELINVHLDPGPFETPWSNVPISKYHTLNDMNISEHTDKIRLGRAFISEVGNQFRDEEFIVSVKLKGSGVFYQTGFSTDISESCTWLTPFIKHPANLQDLRTMVPFAKNSLSNGLHIVLDAEAFDYGVSVTGSEGFVLSLSHQLDIPIMKNIGINIQTGQDVQIAVTPALITTKLGAKKRFDPVRRQCYFEEEIRLKHFPSEMSFRYEMSNCLYEATLQAVENVCNCTPKNYLELVEGYEICEGNGKKCMRKIIAEMGDRRTIQDAGIKKPCLAACEDQTLKILASQASYPNHESFSKTDIFCHLLKKLLRSCNGDRRTILDQKQPNLCSSLIEKENITSGIDCVNFENSYEYEMLLDEHFSNTTLDEVLDYAQKNLVKVSIYIKDPYVSKFVTEEKITEIAFVGTIGGILGIFLGFSFISSAEIVFIFCLKPLTAKKFWN